jgi:CHAT domain-containing protein
LPGVQQEVNKISKTVNTKVFNGSEASEANFRTIIKDFNILHLAMHAFINDSVPSFSWLAFDQDTSTNLESDGRLNIIDIYNLNINASLTVLSACNTGGGQLKKGEGIMSLARGFFYAGCPSVIMSLWEVEDQSGSQIMSSFYKYLKKGKTKDEALRLAKLEYLDRSNSRRAHPHYWLGYISLGNNSALYKSYDFYFFIFLIVLVVGIFTDQVYRIKKARKKRAF